MARFERVADARFRLEGVLGEYVRNVSDRWLKTAPFANPAMLEMFRDRDRRVHRDLVPWAGEFAGKYLTAAVQVLRLTGDGALRDLLHAFVTELLSLQADNGYLGPWPLESALTNRAPSDGSSRKTWDTWSHYHLMLGLLLWHEETGQARALTAARRIADLLCDRYLGAKSPRLVDTGNTEMNLAPAHALCLLYRRTREQRYLDLARQIVCEWSATDADGEPLAGNYLFGPLAGFEFFELPKPRWESLHTVMALAELGELLDADDHRRAFECIWRSIRRTDRHNHGGFSSAERATGNPFDRRAVETCCTVAWMALSVEMLRLTGESHVADELELSTFNAGLGLHSRSGRWSTYNTPMDGVRLASAHEIVFQAREGAPELNCCSVNSPRVLGLLSEWALLRDEAGLVLNWYGPGLLAASPRRGLRVEIRQRTRYPWSGRVAIEVRPRRKAAFALRLRIPRWSARTRVKVNGETVRGVEPGQYLCLERTWKKGDTIEAAFDMSLHAWQGQKECAGRTALYRGPILLACDRRYNDFELDDAPRLEAAHLSARRVKWTHWLPPRLLLEFTGADGRPLRLCDFASAGEGGSPYRTWLEVDHTGAALPEYFATDILHLLRADLGRYAVECDILLRLRRELHKGRVKPEDMLAHIHALREGWSQYTRDRRRALTTIASRPEAEISRSLQQALQRLERDFQLMEPSIPEVLSREERDIRETYHLSQ